MASFLVTKCNTCVLIVSRPSMRLAVFDSFLSVGWFPGARLWVTVCTLTRGTFSASWLIYDWIVYMRFLMVAISVVMVVMVLARLVFSTARLSTWILSISVASTKVWIYAVVSLWYPLFALLTNVFENPLTWSIACPMWRFSRCDSEKCVLKIGHNWFPMALRFH